MKSSRIILDTNLWISFLISKKFDKLDELIENKNIILCLSVFFPKIIPSIGYRCDHQSIKNIVKISSVELKTVFI